MHQDTSLTKPVVVALFILISVFAGIWYSGIRDESLPGQARDMRGRLLSIEGVRVYVDIADEKSEWEKGLSGRDSLAPLRGMLFVFPTADYYKIWMKNMNFPIDVFWIDDNGKIVDIWHHAMPDSYPNAYKPNKRARYILETVADFADEHGIEIGDSVLKLPR